MSKMYAMRKKNISVFRGCEFNCIYCNFGKLLKLNNKCSDCREYKPHAHMEALNKIPPKTSGYEFNTIGLSSDISFMNPEEFNKGLDYVRKYPDRTFMIQSKNPEYFLQWNNTFPDNLIVGTTIESNRLINYHDDFMSNICWYIHNDDGFEPISLAPSTIDRYRAMRKLNVRKWVTIEPIIDFDISVMYDWIYSIKPELVWIGYDSSNNNLPEPTLKKVNDFIKLVTLDDTPVNLKLIRNPIRIVY